MMEHGSALTGCSTNCVNDTVSDKNNYLGFTCCQTTIPHYLKLYAINLTHLERHGGGCRSAFLVDKDSFVFRNKSFIPVSLLWTLTDHDGDQITCCGHGLEKRLKVDLGNSTTVDSWKCFDDYAPTEGTSYLADGCHGLLACCS